jgi:hypothetical protein
MLDVLNKLINKIICKKYDLEFSIECVKNYSVSTVGSSDKPEWLYEAFIIKFLFKTNSLEFKNVENDLDMILNAIGGNKAWKERKYSKDYCDITIKIFVSFYTN